MSLKRFKKDKTVDTSKSIRRASRSVKKAKVPHKVSKFRKNKFVILTCMVLAVYFIFLSVYLIIPAGNSALDVIKLYNDLSASNNGDTEITGTSRFIATYNAEATALKPGSTPTGTETGNHLTGSDTPTGDEVVTGKQGEGETGVPEESTEESTEPSTEPEPGLGEKDVDYKTVPISEEKFEVNIGLSNTYRIAWISDAHVVGNPNCSDNRYELMKSTQGEYSKDVFLSAVKYATNESNGYDAIIFGGDIIDYCSKENYDILMTGMRMVQESGIPYVFITGGRDHDKYTGRGYPDGDVVAQLVAQLPVGHTDVTLGGELAIHGVVDSSEVGAVQTGTVSSIPTLLAVHVPVDARTDETQMNQLCAGHNNQYYWWKYGNPTNKWKFEDDASYKNFCESYIYGSSSVRAVLCGHYHVASATVPVNGSTQEHFFYSTCLWQTIGTVTVR